MYENLLGGPPVNIQETYTVNKYGRFCTKEIKVCPQLHHIQFFSPHHHTTHHTMPETSQQNRDAEVIWQRQYLGLSGPIIWKIFVDAEIIRHIFSIIFLYLMLGLKAELFNDYIIWPLPFLKRIFQQLQKWLLSTIAQSQGIFGKLNKPYILKYYQYFHRWYLTIIIATILLTKNNTEIILGKTN